MQPYALYGLLPHYSLGLEIVVAYAKALNSSTLTSSLLWVVKAAMHTLMAHLFHSYAPVPGRRRAAKAAPRTREYSSVSARRTSGETSLTVHIRGASCHSGALWWRVAQRASLAKVCSPVLEPRGDASQRERLLIGPFVALV